MSFKFLHYFYAFAMFLWFRIQAIYKVCVAYRWNIANILELYYFILFQLQLKSNYFILFQLNWNPILRIWYSDHYNRIRVVTLRGCNYCKLQYYLYISAINESSRLQLTRHWLSITTRTEMLYTEFVIVAIT